LKKKTQDLEKFKFVLDFKIKQLKEEITPMQNEILSLKEKTKDMDNELKRFNKTNANLGYIVDELRTKQNEIQQLISKYKTKIRKNKFLQNSQMVDVYEVLQHQMDPEMLRRSVNANLFKYIENNEQKDVEIDGEIKKEFES